MELIKPSEISARILTLLDESDERVIMVSPYMKVSKWYKFVNKIKGLKTRRIQTEIYVRDDPDNVVTYHDLDQLALQYIKIPHLHCKLYLNERYGIVTSMNLLLSSEINSLEIGYSTETWEEYNDLLDFYHRYVHIGEPVYWNTIAGRPAADMKEFQHRIREELKRTGKNAWICLKGNALHISTAKNNYYVLINNGCLRITLSYRVNLSLRIDTGSRVKAGSRADSRARIDSGTRQESFQPSSLIMKRVGDLTNMKVVVHPGPGPDILQLSGQAQHRLKSNSISGILEDEAAYIFKSVGRFIANTDDMVI